MALRDLAVGKMESRVKTPSTNRRSAKAPTKGTSRLRKINSRKRSAVQNRYEDATFSWGERSWLPAAVSDTRIEADASTPLELVRRSRYWTPTSSIRIDYGDIF